MRSGAERSDEPFSPVDLEVGGRRHRPLPAIRDVVNAGDAIGLLLRSAHQPVSIHSSYFAVLCASAAVSSPKSIWRLSAWR